MLILLSLATLQKSYEDTNEKELKKKIIFQLKFT